MSPKVSICIPAYEQPELLRRLLNSINDQTFKDYEVIITDDSFDDSVKNVVKDFGKCDRIKYYKNSQKNGSPENWNEAIKHASGEYIKIMHHDDWFADTNSLFEFVKMLQDNPDVSLAFCSSINKYKTKKSIHTPTKKELFKLSRDPKCLIKGNTIGAPSTTIYKNKLGIQYDNKLKWYVDIDFYIRVLSHNKKFAFNSKPLVCISANGSHRVTNECINNKKINLFEFFHVFQKIETQKITDYKYLKFIIRNILLTYDVKSEHEIVELGINMPLSPLIKRAILVNKILLRLKKAIKYIINLINLQ